MSGAGPEWALLIRAGNWLCALPLGCVVETMRPLAIEPLASAPAFVRGLARVRGTPIPVVDLGTVVGTHGDGAVRRFVTVAVGERQAALAVDAVLGVRDLAALRPAELPPLLARTAHETIQALGSLDAELLLVLRAGRVVPPEAWDAYARGTGAS